jgi:hypothetical protein
VRGRVVGRGTNRSVANQGMYECIPLPWPAPQAAFVLVRLWITLPAASEVSGWLRRQRQHEGLIVRRFAFIPERKLGKDGRT